MNDGFEPLLVSRADASPLAALGADAGPPALGASSGCAREAEASCSSAIGLIDRGALDAGPTRPALPSGLALPACAGELGELGAPEPLRGLEFGDDVYGPSLAGDGRTLYFSAYVGGEQQLYAATRDARGAEFSNVVELPVVNSPAMDGSPFITADGQRLYFFSERSAGAVGRRDIWVSERVGDAFEVPALVPGINSPSSELLPWLTPDELTVLFVSGRTGGRGAADLWRATRADASESFGSPSNVEELSSSDNEGRLVLSRDGSSAYFTSDRGGSGSDIWTATRDEARGTFSQLRRLDALNSDASELDLMLSSDDRELFFASNRGGRSALYRAERGCR